MALGSAANFKPRLLGDRLQEDAEREVDDWYGRLN